MKNLPINLNLISTTIEELPDDQFRVTYYVGEEEVFSMVFPDAEAHKSLSAQMLIWNIFVQFSLVGPIPSILEDFTRLVPDILHHLPQDSELYEAIESLGSLGWDALSLEPCDCDHCKAFQPVSTHKKDKSKLN